MFPISDSIKSKKLPLVTILLIGLNVYYFIKELQAPDINIFIQNSALIPNKINVFNYRSLLPFLTSMFVHAGFFHIISNMWFLWIFGDGAESYFGPFWFLILYIISGLAGGIFQYVLSPASAIPMLGASGAASGILGAYYILYPAARIKTFIPIFIFITIAEIPAVIYLFYWFFVQLFSGIASLGFTSQAGGVAFWAHVAGFTAGVFFAKLFKEKEDKEYIEGEIVE